MFKYIILFFLLTTCAYAQDLGFTDFGENTSALIYTDTTKFNGPGVLSASDVTVQDALQTLDNMNQGDVPCNTTDSWCFVYNTSTQQLEIYVNNGKQSTNP